MKYAVIATGGKQYKVEEGTILEVEKLDVEADKTITFDQVLLYVVDDTVVVGQPTLTDVVVTAKVLDQVKGEKIRVAKFKAKARYRKVTGHRQKLTRVQVSSIAAKGEKVAKKTETTEKSKKEETKA
jgi:large subunit ribosomal protein L21